MRHGDARSCRRVGAGVGARRAEIVAGVRAVGRCEFVNGGGTGSMERTAPRPRSRTSPPARASRARLFDTYRGFARDRRRCSRCPWCAGPPEPPPRWAAAIRPRAPAGRDRLPRPYLPAGCGWTRREGAGEVQTPLHGPGGRRPARSAIASGSGTPRRASCESASTASRRRGGEIVDTVPTYRGEGRLFFSGSGGRHPRCLAVEWSRSSTECGRQRVLVVAAGPDPDLVRVGVDRLGRFVLGGEHHHADGLLALVARLVRARGPDREAGDVAGTEHVDTV